MALVIDNSAYQTYKYQKRTTDSDLKNPASDAADVGFTVAAIVVLPQVYENSMGMKFVWIESGEFIMGSEVGGDDEKPVHHVRTS